MTAKDQGENASAEQQLIRELAELLNETGLSEIEIEKSGLKVRVARTRHRPGRGAPRRSQPPLLPRQPPPPSRPATIPPSIRAP